MRSIPMRVFIFIAVLCIPLYYPQTVSAKTTDQVSGKATIYSDKFNGKKTATGERFSQNKLTAASPCLPIGSKVKVTNPKTGKTATVLINDKQPKGGGRVLDLSKASAKTLGVKGTGKVKAKVVSKG